MVEQILHQLLPIFYKLHFNSIYEGTKRDFQKEPIIRVIFSYQDDWLVSVQLRTHHSPLFTGRVIMKCIGNEVLKELPQLQRVPIHGRKRADFHVSFNIPDHHFQVGGGIPHDVNEIRGSELLPLGVSREYVRRALRSSCIRLADPVIVLSDDGGTGLADWARVPYQEG